MSLSNPNTYVSEQRLKEFYDGITPFMSAYKRVLTETLLAGHTTVTFTGLPSDANYIVDFYTSNGTNYNSLDQSGSTVTLTFDAPLSDVTVFCEIKTTESNIAILNIRDAYKAKVYGDMTGLSFGDVIGFLNRTTNVSGRWVVDTENTTVWLYAEFTMIERMSGDWYALLELDGFNSASFLPQYKSTTRELAILTTDDSSSVPSNSFFVQTNKVSVHKGDVVNASDRYVVYGSWQY